MALGETTVTVVGRVASDLTAKRENDHDVVGFWLVSVEGRYDGRRASWVDGRSLRLWVTCRRRLATAVIATLGRGDPVIATGRIHTGRSPDDAHPRSVLELEASTVGPDLSRCAAITPRRSPRPQSLRDAVWRKPLPARIAEPSESPELPSEPPGPDGVPPEETTAPVSLPSAGVVA
jgi:single-strand DNA-binding protein